MIVSFWRRRDRRPNGRLRQVAAWVALDSLPSSRDGAGIWPDTHLTPRAGEQ